MPRLEATQANRPLAVLTPLGADTLLFYRMSGSESLGSLFQFDLELLSTDSEINIEAVLGQNVAVRFQRLDGEQRYFNGFVSEFSQEGTHGDLYAYQATLRPWFWFLTRTSDCRIFQEISAPDIIKEVFRDHGFSDFEDALSGNYPEWEYCVQYRETDFNFLSRLMEQEGIYYYFKHEETRHTLVLCDAVTAHDVVPGYEEVPFYTPQQSELQRRERDHISEWSLKKSIQPGAYALNDFDFTKPRASLVVRSAIVQSHEQSEFEIYDYPGEYRETADGENYARTRIEELHAQYERVLGEGNAGGLTTGSLFKLTNFAREDQNRDYLITSSGYTLGPQEYEAAALGGDGSLFFCRFTAIDKQQPFRLPRTTPKPTVQGPQTAIIVGPAGEEIWTDSYGRVKVQFHWDRYGEVDEKSSCWIRVSHPWAGKNWGAVALPRMGQEVIVSFLEGDPDRPMITGRVYNSDNMPPYELPANKTQTGIKSRSSKSGSPDNFNEIRFEDKKGQEQLYIHAEKNQDNIVENDETTSVGHDRSEEVGNDEDLSIGNNRAKRVGVDQSESIGSNKSISVGVDHSETIGANMTLSVGANQSIKVGSNKTETVSINTAETIGAAKELTIGGAYQVTVGAAMNETIGGLKAEEVGAVKSVNVGANSSENIGRNKSVDAGGNISENAGKDVSLSSGKKMALSAGDDFAVAGSKKGVIDIADELTIKCGKASITMKKNGDITISGKVIHVKGSGDVVIKGKNILQN